MHSTKEEPHTYLNNASQEDPDISSDGDVFYFNSTLEDLCPFILNSWPADKIVEKLGWALGQQSGGISTNFLLKHGHFYIGETGPLRLAFRKVQSEKFEKNAQELLAYRMPISRIIEENSMKGKD